MKKTIFLLIFALLISLFANTSCAKETEAYVGMSYDEFRELVPAGEEHLSYLGYFFYYDKSDQPVVVCMDNSFTKIEEVVILPKGKPSMRDFKKIKDGMTVIECCELLGMPSFAFGSGFSYLVFETNRGERVSMSWSFAESPSWNVMESNQ